MATQKEMPFASVLAALFNDEDLPIHLLYRLSDLSEADFVQFKRQWVSVDEERRVALARHMADIAEDNFLVDFSPVFAYLFNDSSASVRVAALDGVWDVESPELIQPIIGLLKNDREASVRAAAARALAHFILLAEWGQIDGRLSEPIVEALLAEYERPATTLEVKRAALESVSSATHPRIPDLINDAYEEGSDDLQLSAIFAMGNTADDRWMPILEQELTSPSADFRAEAARACGMIGAPEAIDLLEPLLTDEEPEVGLAAVYALGQIGGDQAYELLSRMAEDPAFEDYYDAIDEALEELEWMDSEFDMLAFPDQDDDDDINSDDDLRLN